MRSAFQSIALGLVLILIAATFDAEALYVAGSALCMLGAFAAAWIGLGAKGTRIERSVERRRVLEKEALPTRVIVKGGRLPLPSGWVDDRVLATPFRISGNRREMRFRVDITFGRRGKREIPGPVLHLRDPLGMAERVIWGDAKEVLVLPQIFPIRMLAPGIGEDLASQQALLTGPTQTEIDGLKPHVEGAPASRVYWPSLARGIGLMERKLLAEADRRPLVVLDLKGAESQKDADAAVRAAASLILDFARRGGVSAFLPGDQREVRIDQRLTSWPSVHVRLALLQNETPLFTNKLTPRRRPVVYVAARSLTQLPQTLVRGANDSVIVTPFVNPGRRALFEVAGCYGYSGPRNRRDASRPRASERH